MPFWHSHGLVCPRQLLLPSQTGQDHGCFRCNQSHNVKLPEQSAVSSLLHPEYRQHRRRNCSDQQALRYLFTVNGEYRLIIDDAVTIDAECTGHTVFHFQNGKDLTFVCIVKFLSVFRAARNDVHTLRRKVSHGRYNAIHRIKRLTIAVR